MIITPALIALVSLAAQASPANQQKGLVVDGKEIPLRLISTPPIAPPEGFLDWKGLEYLQGNPGTLATPYRSIVDWSELSKAHEALDLSRALPWRAKVVVLTRAETMGQDPSGVLALTRDSLNGAQLQGVLESISRAAAAINTRYGGAIDFQPMVTVDQEPARDTATGDFGDSFAQTLLSPQINGGVYEAEDRVFRGPYQSVFYVVPGFGPSGVSTVVNGTPATLIRTGTDPLNNLVSVGGAMDVDGRLSPQTGWRFGDGVIESQFLEGIAGHVRWRLAHQGITEGGSPSPEAAAWAAALDEPASDVFAERLETGVHGSIPINEAFQWLSTPSWLSSGYDVTLEDDTAQGKVLRIVSKAGMRGGGVALPKPADGVIARLDAGGTLHFTARSISTNPIAIRLDGGERPIWISLGRELPTGLPSTGTTVLQVPFTPDGQWHPIAVDLKEAAASVKMTAVSGIAIEQSLNSMQADALDLGNSDYYFTGFKFSNDAGQSLLAAPVVAFDSPEPIGRALAASQATTSSPELIALLDDVSPLVRLNAAEAFTRISDPTAEPALIAAMADMVFGVQERATIAVGNLNTPTGIAKLRNQVRLSLSDPGKSIAARVLAKTGDPKVAGDLLILFTSASPIPVRGPKIAALDALAAIPGSDPRLRIPLLRYIDPAVRLRAIELADVKNAEYMSYVSWHAVNDPFDRVRAASYAKLIESETPKLVEEGLGGVRDDSVYVRKLVLLYLKSHPTAAAKPALLIGIADRNASVRAAALDALAVSPGAVTVEEIANVVTDKHPAVIQALENLRKAKGLPVQ